ncbi:uncharacterized protein K489DRAFT_380154 [Dissoconium aciculare CBS 342.82]|jgi:hypothetical protein|uniref:Uncharacterized protein n=1 Tax=Dissoconium aciculare CBS 342.82 TaxID=1314786 RepID=A0A6J3M425_9PEZI|nr:uncharacterized protein K489DRAFT_380154 [Dissoconium aciculare CBS 342.82]KAF1822775.1 hypothetical protein K489DRAFT_380154 [Dissoconium aciculare CBS 342.82]
MGGKAFVRAVAAGHSSPATPRMSPAEYCHLVEILHTRLCVTFPDRHVTTLIQAPEKTSHGDIDFLVSRDGQEIDYMKVAHGLGAHAIILSTGACYLACRRDGLRSPNPAIVFTEVKGGPIVEQDASETEPEIYAQVDVRFIASQDFAWHMFTHAYGGLIAILGRMATHAGFRIDDKGLSIRLQAYDDTKGRPHLKVPATLGYCLLSNEPDKVMDFFGLSVQTYHEGFPTWESLFTWLTCCKFISIEVNSTDNGANGKPKPEAYLRFYKDWLPGFIDDQNRLNSEWHISCGTIGVVGNEKQRQIWKDQALERFDKLEEYTQGCAHLEQEIAEQTVSHLLKPIVRKATGLAESKQTEIFRSLRRWVAVVDGKLRVLSESHSDHDSQLRYLLADDTSSLLDQDMTMDWIRDNWELVRALERKAKHKGT